MAATRALQASRWFLGIVYGLGALLLIFGVPTWVGWLALDLFLAVAAVTFLTHWWSGQQGRRSSAQPRTGTWPGMVRASSGLSNKGIATSRR